MPDLDIIVSQLPSAVQDNSADLVMLTQPNAQAETGYSTAKETIENIAKKTVHGIEYETLLSNFPSGKRNPTDAIEYVRNFLMSQLPVNSASGSIANFNTSLALPLVSGKFDIVASQAGSGTPSPSNPRAIIGYTGMNINHSDEDTTNPTVYPITFGSAGTVYGGEVDIKIGKLRGTYNEYIFNGSESWAYRSDGGYFYFSSTLSNAKSRNDYYTSNGLRIRLTNGYIFRVYISDNSEFIDSSSNLNTILTSGIQMLYELYNPIEYDLTNLPEIVALVGTNNIWCDTNGESEVSYKLTSQEYTDQKIAELQAIVLSQ